MSWFLFDERGARAEKLTWLHTPGYAVRGWGVRHNDELGLSVMGFLPERSWRPTFFVAAMAKGYRVFELDVGEHQYVDQNQLTDWWRSASPDQKRIRTIAGVEMYLRAIA